MNVLVEGQYVLTFVGTTTGAIVLPSVAALEAALHDTFPNPGCPIRAYLMDMNTWESCPNDTPSSVFYMQQDETEQYIVSIFRVMELVS